MNYTAIEKKLDISKPYWDDESLAHATHYLHNPTNTDEWRVEESVPGYFTKNSDFQEWFPIKWDVPFPPPENPNFQFIDLFAGIGGFRIALQSVGGKCMFSSEWDKFAKESYFANYGEVPFGDIRKFTASQDALNTIPEHTILAGGFPCQPFSQAGHQKGFEDTRGTLFFEVMEIVRQKQPDVLFLENVKRLKTHNKGKTFETILQVLRDEGYKVYAKVLRAYDFGVPQNRERIFIVAFRTPLKFEFPEPQKGKEKIQVGNILELDPDPKYTISDKLLAGHERRLKEHREKGNGFGFSVFTHESDYANTLSARYYKDGSEILIAQENKNPRKLTPRECARLQGFPEKYRIVVSDAQAYKQFGNSVAVPVVKAVAKQIMKALESNQPAEDGMASVVS